MANIKWLADDIGTISSFLSDAECDEYIAFSEAKGYEEAPVSTDQGMVMIKDVRNNDRVMLDDCGRSSLLYQRLSLQLPKRFKKKWEPVALNERLRLYRYDVGQQFDWHLDGYFERDNGERSFFTFMVYLNDDFEGGATSFRTNDYGTPRGANLRVKPSKGMALLFHHPLQHRGDPVTAGRKYVLRTDVMYARLNRDKTVEHAS
jgi:predicted 2-oxoglutarate/Fe(II)-dependent dioxygenase YbiX